MAASISLGLGTRMPNQAGVRIRTMEPRRSLTDTTQVQRTPGRGSPVVPTGELFSQTTQASLQPLDYYTAKNRVAGQGAATPREAWSGHCQDGGGGLALEELCPIHGWVFQNPGSCVS